MILKALHKAKRRAHNYILNYFYLDETVNKRDHGSGLGWGDFREYYGQLLGTYKY